MPTYYTIPAGELDQLITLQRRVAGTDARGQESETWETAAADVWARVRPLAGRDFAAAAADQAAASIRIEIQAGAASVLPGMRVQWAGQPWDIVGQPLTVDRAWLRFDATTGVRDAHHG